MSLMNRLLGIWIVGRTVSSTTPLFMRLILGMAVITLLAVFCGVILAVLVAGGAWFGYSQLVAHGASSAAAFAVVALWLLALLFGVVLVLQYYWNKAYGIAKRIMYLQSPISGRVSSIADAFMKGYHAK